MVMSSPQATAGPGDRRRGGHGEHAQQRRKASDGQGDELTLDHGGRFHHGRLLKLLQS
jgi:hypothetical protein